MRLWLATQYSGISVQAARSKTPQYVTIRPPRRRPVRRSLAARRPAAPIPGAIVARLPIRHPKPAARRPDPPQFGSGRRTAFRAGTPSSYRSPYIAVHSDAEVLGPDPYI